MDKAELLRVALALALDLKRKLIEWGERMQEREKQQYPQHYEVNWLTKANRTKAV